MTNTTEMPEKIWADDVYWFPEEFDERAGDTILQPYTRTDTIPSRAQVAREFFNMVLRHEQVWLNLMSRSKPPLTRNEFMQVVHDVLKEWEDAEAK